MKHIAKNNLQLLTKYEQGLLRDMSIVERELLGNGLNGDRIEAYSWQVARLNYYRFLIEELSGSYEHNNYVMFGSLVHDFDVSSLTDIVSNNLSTILEYHADLSKAKRAFDNYSEASSKDPHNIFLYNKLIETSYLIQNIRKTLFRYTRLPMYNDNSN